MDLTGFNAAEKAALSDDLSEMLSVNPNVHQILNKTTYAQGVVGLNYVYTPGLEGITFGKHLGQSDKIRLRDTKLRPKTCKLEPWNSAYPLEQQDILDMKKGGNLNQLLLSNMARAIPWTFYAAMIEFLANSPGDHGVFPTDYDCTSPDGQASFSATGYLDNIQTLSGLDYGSIKNDINGLIAKLFEAKLPQSDIGYWEGTNIVEMEMVVIFPPRSAGGAQLIQAFRQAFESEDALHTIGGVIYNASGTNLEFKFNVTLIPSVLWKETFGDKWCVLLLPKDRNVKYAPVISLHENSGMVGDYSNVTNGMNFKLGAGEGNAQRNTGLFSIATLGPGSTFYEENRKWAHSVNGYLGMTQNRYLMGIVQ